MMDISTIALLAGGVLLLIGFVVIGFLRIKPRKPSYHDWLLEVEKIMGATGDCYYFDFKECWEFGSTPAQAAEEAWAGPVPIDWLSKSK